MKLLIIIIILGSIFQNYAFASFAIFVEEFSKSNNDLEILNLDLKKSEIKQSDFDSNFDWNFMLSLQDTESFPQAFFSFQSQETSQNSYSFGLNKNFSFGSSISLTHTQTQYDLSKWTTTAPFQEGYEAKNILSFTQDLGRNFIGQNYRAQENLSQKNYQYELFSNSFEKQKKYYDFITTYLQLKLQKTILNLNIQAISRQEALFKNVLKKFNDGISPKIEKLQSEMALETLRSKLQNVKVKFEQIVNNLNFSLGRKISNEEITEYDFERSKINLGINGTAEDNLAYIQAQKLEEVMQLNEVISKFSSRPDLKFALSYTTNAINENKSTAISDGNFGGDNKVLSLSLNLNIPIENTLLKNQEAKARIDALKAKHNREDQYKRSISNLSMLDSTIKIYQQSIKLEKKKLEVSKLTLKENIRLYRLGKAEIETVLKSEENLIDAEQSLASILYEFDVLIFQDALAKGKVFEMIKKFKEFNE